MSISTHLSVTVQWLQYKVPLVGCFMPLVGMIRRPVESPLKTLNYHDSYYLLLLSNDRIIVILLVPDLPYIKSNNEHIYFIQSVI